MFSEPWRLLTHYFKFISATPLLSERQFCGLNYINGNLVTLRSQNVNSNGIFVGDSYNKSSIVICKIVLLYLSLSNSSLSTDPSTNAVTESQNKGSHQHLSALCFRNIIQENEYMNAYVFHSTAMKHVAI